MLLPLHDLSRVMSYSPNVYELVNGLSNVDLVVETDLGLYELKDGVVNQYLKETLDLVVAPRVRRIYHKQHFVL